MERATLRPRKFLSAFATLLFVNVLVGVHQLSTLYVHSSFLGEFFSPKTVSVLFIIASVAVAFFLLAVPRFAGFIGVWRTLIVTIVALQLSMLFLGFSKTPTSVILFFVAVFVLVFVLRYLLDLYIESLSRDESQTGNTRGFFLTAFNIGVFFGPIAVSLIVVGNNFAPLYAFSALVLTPVFFIALGPLRAITPKKPRERNIFSGVQQIFCCRPHIRHVMVVNFMMQLFAAAITIYAPLYLFEIGNFSWQTIGSITALALLPYLFLEIPLGFLADRFIGEKEIMVFGLAVLGSAMILLTATPLSLFVFWSAWFVMTRIGAAAVEISTESYFFKQVNEEDAALISAFRSLQPLGGIAAPLIALVVLLFAGVSSVFAVFGVVFLLAIPFALRIHDTR